MCSLIYITEHTAVITLMGSAVHTDEILRVEWCFQHKIQMYWEQMQCIEDQCNVLTRVQRIQQMQCALLALPRMLEYLHLINISSNIHTVALANTTPPPHPHPPAPPNNRQTTDLWTYFRCENAERPNTSNYDKWSRESCADWLWGLRQSRCLWQKMNQLLTLKPDGMLSYCEQNWVWSCTHSESCTMAVMCTHNDI